MKHSSVATETPNYRSPYPANQIQPAAPNTQVGDIAHPHLIGPLRGEVALQPIRCHRIPMLRIRRHPEPATCDRAQTRQTHTSWHTILAHAPAPLCQLPSDLRATGAPLAGLKQLLDRRIQSLRLLGPRTGRTLLPRCETPSRLDTSPQRPTGRGARRRGGSVSLLSLREDAHRFFRISRSRVTRPSSRRRRRTSSSRSLRWPVPGKASSPPIPQRLFPPTDDALADSQALLHLDCGTALFRSHAHGLQLQLSIELPDHENTSCAKI